MLIDPPTTIESINTLKAEILSPDWTISPRRNATCCNAMVNLNLYFKERRYAKGLVAIARQILGHLEESKESISGSIDLLKEIMAHIVTIYEQDANDVTEKKICAKCLRRFKSLGIPIKATGNKSNKFTTANMLLKQDVSQLHSLSAQFEDLSTAKQVQAMLTIQSLIAETKELQKIMATASL